MSAYPSFADLRVSGNYGKPQRIVTGPESMKAGRAVAAAEAARAAWPYAWTYQPPNGIRRTPWGSVATPIVGAGNQVEVLVFTVPQGFRFELDGIVWEMDGAKFNTGDFLWTLDKNTPLGATVGLLQGQPIQDFTSVPFPLGSFKIGTVWPVSHETFDATDVIRIKCTNVSGPVGAPNALNGMLLGWTIPEED